MADTARINRLLSREHGVVRTQRLVTGAEVTRGEIRALVARGHLHRHRRGWVGWRDLDADVATAVRAGGALTCTRALARVGVWVPPAPLHVRPTRDALDAGGHVWCRPRGPLLPVRRAVDTWPLAFASLLSCGSAEDVAVVIDSLLHERVATMTDLEHLVRRFRPSRLPLLAGADSEAASGLETLVRVRLRALGHRVRSQVPLVDVGRVDLLVDDWYVIETDGRQFHEDFERDRRRDLRRDALGHHGARLTYRMVVHDWDDTLLHLRAALRHRPRRLPKTA